MAIEVRKMSWWDTLVLQCRVGAQALLWGLVAPNRLLVPWLARWDMGRSTNRFIDALRRKYRCAHLWTRFPWQRTLLVLDAGSFDAVLASASNAADPPLKKRPFSQFVPGGVIVSEGEQWEERRRFNEEALDLGRLHRHGDTFSDTALREVERTGAGCPGVMRWPDFESLGLRIAHQVILGSGQIETEMAIHLARMVKRGNWLVLGRHRPSFAGFYAGIGRHLAGHRDRVARAGAEPGPLRCLIHESARLLERGGATASTEVPSQIGFWMFVLKDAVELHTARTLALIAAHPEVQERLRRDIRNLARWTAEALDGLSYLEACLREQLRLWTPVPILLRRATHPFSLGNAIRLEPEQQILLHAGFYHRDASVFGDHADRFSPGALTGAFPRTYNFSRFRQSCAGQDLARLVLKATLAALLARFRFELAGPKLDPLRIPCLYDHVSITLRALAEP